MLLNPSNKSLKLIFLMLFSFILSACFPSVPPLASQIIASATVQSNNTQIPVPTDDLIAQKQKLLDKASRNVDAFNQLVEQEKLLGSIETSHDSGTGQEFFRFTGESDKKIRVAHENLINQLEILRTKYLALYKQDYSPTPFPAFNTKDEALSFYYQSLQQNQNWVESQLKAENALKIYDPDLGTYESFLNFEQSTMLDLKNEALSKLRLDVELSPDLLAKHQAVVEKLDGEPIEAFEITSLPFYRSDLTLFQYQTPKSYYILNADGIIIEVIPVEMPISETYTPVAPLNVDQLEEKARSFIKLVAPEINVDALTPAGGSKIGSYFFRWEDRTKPLLDDGRSYPFIQVALNQDGELLNYYNTLPLSR